MQNSRTCMARWTIARCQKLCGKAVVAEFGGFVTAVKESEVS